MWGAGFLIGIALLVSFWFLILRPEEKAFHRKRLKNVKNRLKHLEERNEKETPNPEPTIVDDKHNDHT